MTKDPPERTRVHRQIGRGGFGDVSWPDLDGRVLDDVLLLSRQFVSLRLLVHKEYYRYGTVASE